MDEKVRAARKLKFQLRRPIAARGKQIFRAALEANWKTMNHGMTNSHRAKTKAKPPEYGRAIFNNLLIKKDEDSSAKIPLSFASRCEIERQRRSLWNSVRMQSNKLAEVLLFSKPDAVWWTLQMSILWWADAQWRCLLNIPKEPDKRNKCKKAQTVASLTFLSPNHRYDQMIIYQLTWTAP